MQKRPLVKGGRFAVLLELLVQAGSADKVALFLEGGSLGGGIDSYRFRRAEGMEEAAVHEESQRYQDGQSEDHQQH